MTIETIAGLVSVAIVLGGVLITVGRNMQKIKTNSEGLAEVKGDVDNVYSTIRKESKETRDQIAAGHTEVLRVLEDHGTRIGQVEGELKRINGG